MNELSQPALPATPNEIPQKSGREFFWASPHVLGLVLLGGTFVLYWPVTRNGFVDYDDGLYVAGNAQVQAGLTWDGVKLAFGRLAGERTYWHPLTWLSHMADCQLFGLTAGAHHLVNVLFHGANVCLLFLILRKMTG